MKKAIELSLNFLVTIIIALVIFGFGIKFIYNLASESDKLKDLTFEDLDKRIEDLLCQSTDKVCIPTTKKTIQRGKFDVFGIKITNILNDQEFGIDIASPTPAGYKKDNTPIDTSNIETKYRESIFIKKNDEEEIGIGVEVPRNAVSGTYIFNVEIYYEDSAKLYETLQKIYVEVP